MSKNVSKLLYEGSVKNVWLVNDDTLEFEYTDAYSVFDWGKMPDSIPKKGEALTTLAEFFFKYLHSAENWKNFRNSIECQNLLSFYKNRFDPPFDFEIEKRLIEFENIGVRHHFYRRTALNRMLVQRCAVQRPYEYVLCGHTLYHYNLSRSQHWNASQAPLVNAPNDAQHSSQSSRLVPLEVVFRLGLPSGSSLVSRLTPEYAKLLGLATVPQEGSRFDAPILEFFSKLEPQDRFLSWEQALNYSQVSFEEFKTLIASSLLIASLLESYFKSKNLELWDGKFEWALQNPEHVHQISSHPHHVLAPYEHATKSSEFMLIDSIGLDELRIIEPQSQTHFSKEFIRQFYRKTPWYKEVNEAKAQVGMNWKKLVLEKYGQPPRLVEPFLSTAENLYLTLVNTLTGQELSKNIMSISQLTEELKKCLKF